MHEQKLNRKKKYSFKAYYQKDKVKICKKNLYCNKTKIVTFISFKRF